MYKYLLCWRYLRTRYIALASVVSVMLGVATMIVVNAVMAGFADKMKTRLHGVLADIVVESMDLDGFPDSAEVMARIKQVAGDDVVAMAPTMQTYGLMEIILPNGRKITRQVEIHGIRPQERSKTGEFAEFLVDEGGQKLPASFEVPPELRSRSPRGQMLRGMNPNDPLYKFFQEEAQEQVPDDGALIGYATATLHRPGAKEDDFLTYRGGRISLVFPTAGRQPKPGNGYFTVVGFFKSGMSEYDSTHVYVPLERLQYLRLLGDGEGHGAVNQIQVKAKPGANLDELAYKLQLALNQLRPKYFLVSTWEHKQGPLLAAVAVEQGILNILLFFIIAVAGFGILAIFSMIVVEKTRDIGVLKALGASTSGIRRLFLGYGLSLGIVGSGIGMLGGLIFVARINKIEEWLSKLTGRKVFDDSIYYFNEIPTLIEPWTVGWIVTGALLIAIIASIWPAQRAARLHPVQALRFE